MGLCVLGASIEAGEGWAGTRSVLSIESSQFGVRFRERGESVGVVIIAVERSLDAVTN